MNSRLRKNNSGQTVKIPYNSIYNCVQNCKNEHACVFRKLCQVIFCCRHFYRARIEPHCKHRSINFLTTQTDQSKGDIFIDYVLKSFSLLHGRNYKQEMHFLANLRGSIFKILQGSMPPDSLEGPKTILWGYFEAPKTLNSSHGPVLRPP